MPESEDRPKPGTPSAESLGRFSDLPSHYVVEAEIGRGGMGTVLRAHDLKHDRKVAIKILRPEIARGLAHERFLLEIRTVARLVHPNLLTVVDSGEAGGTLFFVMPYVEGESLRDRLEREGRLPVADALRILRDVAGALHHAHRHGIVHRDVKPENILLSKEGHTWLVDFGIAQAAAESGNLRLTSTGLILGSPLYTSPEQASGDKPVDGRSDIYSLGCVLFEALSGAPPFAGSSKHALLLQHMTRAAPSLRERQPDVPAELDRITQTALAKSSDARFQTAAEFESALEAVLAGERADMPERWRARERRQRFWYTAAVVAGGVVLTGAVLARWTPVLSRLGLQGPPLTPLDSTRFLVLRTAASDSSPENSAVDRLVDGLRAWNGIDVISPAGAAAVTPPDDAESVSESAGRLAREHNAGRVVHAQFGWHGDSVRIALQLLDGNRPNVNLAKINLTVLASMAGEDRIYVQLADSLLLRGVAPDCFAGGIINRNVGAIQTCDGAFSALQDGDIARADSLLEAALRVDPADARAALWLSETRRWIVAVPPDTRALTTLALDHPERLTSREQALARAQQHVHNEEFAKACDIYQQLIAQDQDDYVPWIGLGECHRRDITVRRDRTAPTGWSFRSSYHRALLAYRQAFELQPSLLAGYRERSFAQIRTLLVTSTAEIVTGKAAAPDTTVFRAYIQLRGDTVVLLPVRLRDLEHLQPGIVPESADRAVEAQIRLLRDLTLSWVRRFPNSVAAQEALAVALEMDGDAAAVAVMEQATRVAADADERMRLTAAGVWLRLKFAMPGNLNEVRRVRTLADSLIQLRPGSPSANRSLTGLALLVGKPSLAAQFARKAAASYARDYQISVGLAQSVRALLVFAAAGGPADSILRLEREVEEDLLNSVSSERRSQTRQLVMARALMIAFPEVQMNSLSALADAGAFTAAEYAFTQNDTAAVLRLLDRINTSRALIRPAERTLDALYIEAWLLNELGRPELAAQRLDPTLNVVRWYPPMRLDDPAHVGPWLRALLLRADIAAKAGDTKSAEALHQAISELWANADSSTKQLMAPHGYRRAG